MDEFAGSDEYTQILVARIRELEQELVECKGLIDTCHRETLALLEVKDEKIAKLKARLEAKNERLAL